jgi:hypothetical protein
MQTDVKEETIQKQKEKREYNNNYYHQIRKFQTKPIICECGKSLNKANMKYHSKTPQHKFYMIGILYEKWLKLGEFQEEKPTEKCIEIKKLK